MSDDGGRGAEDASGAMGGEVLYEEDGCGLGEGDYAPGAADVMEGGADAAAAADFGGGAPAAGAFPATDDVVQVRVRPGEIVIHIKTSALHPPSVDVAVSAADAAGVAGVEMDAAAAAFVGLTNVPADKRGNGYESFRIRTDLKDFYLSAYNQVKALGGVLTSSGGLRDLSAPVTPGRSRTSLHYTGRAIDLYIYTAMQGATDRYMVTRNGGTDANPEWKLWCVSENAEPSSPLYDASLIQEGEIEYLVWKKGTGTVAAKRTARYFCLSDVLERHGWQRIPARKDWRTTYTSVEWWHFQHPQGLVKGVSRFGDELRAVWPAAKVASSGLALNALWRGRSFSV
ncbi:MAG TPA: hypothetical protein VHG08_12670 [Longimicrobium sp.]|nr:hypothetical protein [Longimicrobium sp.]